MNNPPQNVSTRYLTNLLHNGQNAECSIEYCIREKNIVDDVIVGYYWKTQVVDFENQRMASAGATPIQALQRTLEKFNVTFK